MIHMFNRKELLTTLSMEVQGRVRQILAANQIDYTVKTLNLTAPNGSRSRTDAFGLGATAAYQYIIYVKKEDHERALYLIQK